MGKRVALTAAPAVRMVVAGAVVLTRVRVVLTITAGVVLRALFGSSGATHALFRQLEPVSLPLTETNLQLHFDWRIKICLSKF